MDDQVLEMFPAPESIKINNVIEKEGKNITPEADKEENSPKPSVNFTFKKVKSRNISVNNDVKINEKKLFQNR
jgi:hypothetical protein